MFLGEIKAGVEENTRRMDRYNDIHREQKPMVIPTGNGAKAFGGVLALVAIIAGVYAMVEPMGQRIDFLNTQLGRLERRINQDEFALQTDRSLIASMSERFKEVETQFSALRELMVVEFKRLDGENQRDEFRIGTIWPRLRQTEKDIVRLIEKLSEK